MKEHKCENCTWRAKHDSKPKSVIGRLWRWHATWCPGWKAYMNSISAEKRANLVAKYNMQDTFKV